MMHLEKLSEQEVEEVDIPTGTPRLYTLTGDLQVESVRYL